MSAYGSIYGVTSASVGPLLRKEHMTRRRATSAEAKTALRGLSQAMRNKIMLLRQRSIQTMVQLPFTDEDVFKWMFPQDVRDKLSVAYGITATLSLTYEDYKFDKYSLRFTDDTLRQRLLVVTPKEGVEDIDCIAAHPLFNAMQDIEEQRDRWALVLYVADWLNRNATLSAIRYYWPQMWTLVPELNMPELPKLHHTPVGLGPVLPLLREAAAIVSSAVMLPADTPPTPVGITVSFASRRHGVHAELPVGRDHITL